MVIVARRFQPAKTGHAFGFLPSCRQALSFRRHPPGLRGTTLIGRPSSMASGHPALAIHGLKPVRERQGWMPCAFSHRPRLAVAISRSRMCFGGNRMCDGLCKQARLTVCLYDFGAHVAFNRRGAIPDRKPPNVFAQHRRIAQIMPRHRIAVEHETACGLDVVEEARGVAGHGACPAGCPRIIRQLDENTKRLLIWKIRPLWMLAAVRNPPRKAGSLAQQEVHKTHPAPPYCKIRQQETCNGSQFLAFRIFSTFAENQEASHKEAEKWARKRKHPAKAQK